MPDAVSSERRRSLPTAESSGRPESSLFPLPLTPFEEYMLVDDRPAYPSIGCAALRLRGQLDRTIFQSALETALARHPLLQSLVRPARHGRFEWIAAEHIKPVVYWNEEPVAPHAQIDLQREIGLRMYARESDHRTQLLIQLHHACCDGLGYLRFVNDLFSTYHELYWAGAARLERSLAEPERLRHRGRFGMTWAGWLARVPKDLLASLAAIEYFGHRPEVLAPGSEPAPPGDRFVFPLFTSHTFSETETAELRQLARDLGGSVNDLLLTAGFYAIHQWNRRHAPQSRQGVVRIAIPVNLRGPDDDRMPAANVVSMLYLDRRPHRFADARSLVKSVRREMTICKKWRLGLTMTHFIRALRWLPGGLSCMLPEKGSLATAVLSNLGDITQLLSVPRSDDGMPVAGNTVLEGWSPMPPTRPGTHACFGVYSDAGRLPLTVNCDPHRFHAASAQEFLATFVEQLAAIRAQTK